ncbi:cytochrome b5 domain-containing protein [Micropruina sonneratiae]|uniref:cytochrome b5 domain-containing protein n=1 Tax=Micropruina sonneratiae TaxID=2986940 RepID=UPI00222613A9|nr:cytochrome b5-like heme/steroid binding domain-containing protein [Micropruina sp. KQZ13P-5]MCW3158418.1 cytochrome b5 domain-containing protein [Micropruina sp. KQZ13P-5]
MRIRTGTLLAPLAVLVLSACSGGATPSTSPADTATASGNYRMAEVATHNTREDCWAAVDSGVYDLTSWIDRHPGGSDKIIALCGTDATDAFNNQHSGDTKPAEQLMSFRIGTLVD